MSKKSVVLFDNIVAACLSGMAYEESEKSAQHVVEKAITSYETFGHRDVSVTFGSKGITLALGGEITQSGDGPAALTHHPIEDHDQLEKIDFSSAFFNRNERAQLLYQATEQITQALNGKAKVRFCMSAPFTLASQLIGPEKMMRASLKQADRVHQLLQQAVAIQKDILKPFLALDGTIIHLSDPIASGDLVSPRIYKKFAQPYTKELVDYIHKANKEVTLHICGNTMKIIDEMADTGVDWISFDQIVDLSQVSKHLEDRVGILGNVDPLNVLTNGQVSQVEAAVSSCFEQAASHPGGFMIAPGCDIPYHAPVDNLKAFVQKGEELAQ